MVKDFVWSNVKFKMLSTILVFDRMKLIDHSSRYGLYLWLVFEKPRSHPTIDVAELKYIEKSLGESVQQSMPTIASTPWSDIVRSLPVYAIVVANFCRSWNFYMLLMYQSSYLKHRFNFKVEEVTSILQLVFVEY